MKRIALPVAALAVVGGLVWYLFLRDKSPEDTNGDEVADTSSKPDLSKRPKEAPERTDRNQGGEVSVLFDDDPVGNLQLEGLVLDDADVGVGGALVSINSNPPRTVKTEDDGSFAIGKLVGRDYRLLARHSSGSAGPIVSKLTGKSEPVILKLKKASSVLVTVIDAKTSSPIENANVELRGIDRQIESANGEGVATFRHIAPARYEVVASASGYAAQRKRVFVARGAEKVDVQLGLRTGAKVSGVVVSAKGKPVAGARVVFSGASDWTQRANARWDAAETGSDGRFEFSALGAGSFRFVARAEGRAPGRSELVTLDGVTAVDDIKLTMGEGATLRGRVLSSSGDVVASARVRISKGGRRGRRGVRESYADEKGEFEIEGLERAELQVVALSEDAASETLPVDFSAAPFQRTVDITLEIDGIIEGVVTDADGNEIEGAQVWAVPDFRSANRSGGRRGGRASMRLRGAPRALTDPAGRFRLTGIGEGDQMVRATRSGATGRAGWLIEPTSAKAGDTDVVIKLEAEGGLKGKVALQSGEAPGAFSIGISGWGGGTPFSSKDGAFVMENLSPQKYTVTIRGPGFDSKQLNDVEVKPGEVLDLGTVTVKKGRVLIGVVVDASGSPVSGALVRAGRSIFGSGSSSGGTRGGPPRARNAKEARTDESGEFAIYGLPASDVSIVAEHDTAGRSVATLIQNGGESVKQMRLALAPYGSLEGKVLRGGAAAPGVRVSVSSVASPDVTFGVATGEDGNFRFDRLAPDTYKVSGMSGGNPMRGFSFQSQKVVVQSDATAKVTVVLSPGDVELVVSIAESAGKTLNFTWITTFAGEISAQTARQLELEIARQPEGFSAQGMAIAGMPATVRELKAGVYTVCGTPYPPEVTGMAATMGYMEREGDNLPTYCEPITVGESPATQEATLTVTAPAFVPPPSDEG